MSVLQNNVGALQLNYMMT